MSPYRAVLAGGCLPPVLAILPLLRLPPPAFHLAAPHSHMYFVFAVADLAHAKKKTQSRNFRKHVYHSAKLITHPFAVADKGKQRFTSHDHRGT